MKSFRIDDHIYHNSFDLVVNCGWEEFKDMVQEQAAEKDKHILDKYSKRSGLSLELENKLGDRCLIIYVETFSFKIFEIGILTHELKHLTDYVMERADITDKSEAPCYYLEYILVKCLNALHDEARETNLEATVREGKGEKQGQYDKGKENKNRREKY